MTHNFSSRFFILVFIQQRNMVYYSKKRKTNKETSLNLTKINFSTTFQPESVLYIRSLKVETCNFAMNSSVRWVISLFGSLKPNWSWQQCTISVLVVLSKKMFTANSKDWDILQTSVQYSNITNFYLNITPIKRTDLFQALNWIFPY